MISHFSINLLNLSIKLGVNFITLIFKNSLSDSFDLFNHGPIKPKLLSKGLINRLTGKAWLEFIFIVAGISPNDGFKRLIHLSFANFIHEFKINILQPTLLM